jgi:hypothetical protein
MLALHKVTKVTESTTLEIRFEMFNAFNHAQFFGASSVHGNISSATFGYVTHAAPPRVRRWRRTSASERFARDNNDGG